MDRFVAQHLEGVSRTYALVVPMLPPPLDEAVGLAYLLMRIVDTLEDAPQLADDQRFHLFQQLDAALAGDVNAAAACVLPIGSLAAEQTLMRDAPEVIRRVRALEPPYGSAAATCARAMSAGVCGLLTRSAARELPYPAVRDAAELREYCYYVAGTVGEMLCAMKAHYLGQPGLLDRRGQAVDLGIGLQLVNILKDAGDDAHHGRRYLPRPESTAKTPRAPRDRQEEEVENRQVYAAALAEARRCLKRGVEYVLSLPANEPGLRLFCGLPIVWGGMTLTNAQRDATRAKISRAEIAASIERFRQIAGEDGKLRGWLLERIEDTG